MLVIVSLQTDPDDCELLLTLTTSQANEVGALFISFFSVGTLSTEKLSNLPKVTQPISGKTQIHLAGEFMLQNHITLLLMVYTIKLFVSIYIPHWHLSTVASIHPSVVLLSENLIDEKCYLTVASTCFYLLA